MFSPRKQFSSFRASYTFLTKVILLFVERKIIHYLFFPPNIFEDILILGNKFPGEHLVLILGGVALLSEIDILKIEGKTTSEWVGF